MGTVPVFTAVKAGILPVPLAERPMAGLLLVQLYAVLATGPVKLTASVLLPLHNVWLETGFIVGLGLTTTVAVIEVPAQPLAVGVIVKVTVTGALVVFVRVPEMSPLPEATMPVTLAVLFLVQLKVVPETEPVNPIDAIKLPLQIDWVDGVATASGVGLTTTTWVWVEIVVPSVAVTV